MALSMYDASIPVLSRVLTNLSAILDKAAASAEARKIDPAVFIAARLAPDMFPLSRQVQVVSDTARRGACLLAGLEVPSWPDTETSFPELKARLEKTLTFLKTIRPDQIDGSEERTITMPIGGGNEMKLPGQAFLFNFVFANCFFHAATAYAILRHNGVDIGKRDFLGGA
ncbi:MAG TPA: DUF1993 domain-containing protein [Caulobacteraceae bacterium]